MIKIILYKSDDIYVGFNVRGHANFGLQGKDIVCSAVSVLSINTVNSIVKLLELNEENLRIEQSEANIFFGFKRKLFTDEEIQKIQYFIKSFILGIISIKKEYNNNLDINIREV